MQGHHRRWTDGGFPYEEINVELHQHATPEGAQVHFEGFLPFVSSYPIPDNPLSVVGLPAESKGISTTAIEEHAGAMVVFRASRFVVQVSCEGGTVDEVRARTATVALGQLRRLPG